MHNDGANGAQLLQLLRGLARELHPQDPAIEQLGLDASLERGYGLAIHAGLQLPSRKEPARGVRHPPDALTPAEKPKAPARNLGLNFLEKNDMSEPTPVAIPAKIVRPKANRIVEVSMLHNVP